MAEVELQQFDKVRAVIRFQQTDDLKPDMLRLEGRRGLFQVSYLIGDDGHPAYQGQWACLSLDDLLFPYVWLPSGDLTHIEKVDEKVDDDH